MYNVHFSNSNKLKRFIIPKCGLKTNFNKLINRTCKHLLCQIVAFLFTHSTKSLLTKLYEQIYKMYNWLDQKSDFIEQMISWKVIEEKKEK